MLRVCLDLSANEMQDRFGGIGKYANELLRALTQLPPSDTRDLDLSVLLFSDRAPLSPDRALSEVERLGPPIPNLRHLAQRSFLVGQALRRRDVQIFHATQPQGLPYLPGCKVVSTAHDVIPIVFPREKKGLLEAARKRMDFALNWSRYTRPDHLIAISALTRDDLSHALHIALSKITVVHHGIDTEHYASTAAPGEHDALRAKYDLPAKFFVCVSSDHYRKNLETAFRAWCDCAHELPEGLVCIGKAMYEESFTRLTNLAAERGVADRFRWLSNIGDAELPAFYRGATSTIAPSLYEGFGMTLLESMSCGTPVIAASNPAYREVAEADADFFEPKNAAALTDLMRRHSNDTLHRRDLVERGLARARSYSWSKTARETLAVYRTVAQK
ncbi:MAG: glycosyltransferase family 4 protein [Sandaracinaceae bacterium]|jgi:glycosyltransferase involved in cell wall biosynthesis|nr:glycosyltransferase family 4 protein [Sandaracinaceae bacterium]